MSKIPGMYTPDQSIRGDQGSNDFFKAKAELDRYHEDRRLAEQGTSREELEAQEEQRKAAARLMDEAILRRVAIGEAGLDNLRPSELEILNEFAAGSGVIERLQVDRAKSDAEQAIDRLRKQADKLGVEIQDLARNYTANKAVIGPKEAELKQIMAELKQVEASKPRELSNAVINAISAGSNIRKR